MKTLKPFSFYILVFSLLATGCGKDDDTVSDGRIKLFAEQMTQGGNGSKMLFDPTDLNAAEWLAGESIDINGHTYTIVSTNEGYSLDGSQNLSVPLYAIYPATTKDNLGNDITVTNNGASGSCAIDIRSYAVNFTGNGKHQVIFPMAAQYTSDSAADNTSSGRLWFKHLTGGLKLTIQNNKNEELTFTRLVVTATRTNDSAAIYRDIAPDWAGGLLPVLPVEHGRRDDQSVQFVRDMTLMMNTGGQPGVTIQNGQSITFFIPMLALRLKTLSITGYDAMGDVVIPTHSKTISSTNIVRNKMYTIPTIAIN